MGVRDHANRITGRRDNRKGPTSTSARDSSMPHAGSPEGRGQKRPVPTPLSGAQSCTRTVRSDGTTRPAGQMHAHAQQTEPLPAAAEARKRQKPEAGRAKGDGRRSETRKGEGGHGHGRTLMGAPVVLHPHRHVKVTHRPRPRRAPKLNAGRWARAGSRIAATSVPSSVCRSRGRAAGAWCLGLGVNHERGDAGRRGLIGGWAKLAMAGWRC